MIVHFLGRGQRDLAVLFGGETGDEVDKFDLCEWSEGPEGLPVLAGVAGWFAGRVLDRFDLGDHAGLWLEPFAVHDSGAVPDLRFQELAPVDPGHEA